MIKEVVVPHFAHPRGPLGWMAGLTDVRCDWMEFTPPAVAIRGRSQV